MKSSKLYNFITGNEIVHEGVFDKIKSIGTFLKLEKELHALVTDYEKDKALYKKKKLKDFILNNKDAVKEMSNSLKVGSYSPISIAAPNVTGYYATKYYYAFFGEEEI